MEDSMPFGAVGSGIHDGSFNIYDERNLRWPTPDWARNARPYPLPFKVCGYFDLETNEDWQRRADSIFVLPYAPVSLQFLDFLEA